MKNDMLSVGLDIGTTKVVVMVGRRKEDSTVEIIGVGQSPSTGVSKGAIQNISKTISAIRQAVEMAEEASGVKINEVTVGIAGQYIRSARQTDYITRPNPERVIDQDDLDRLRVQVEKAAPHSEHEQIIHVLPQEYKVDAEGGILEPIGMYGQRLEATFHIVIGQVAPLLNVKRCVEGAGLKLAGLKLEPIASSDSTLTEEEKEAGVVLVDIGGGTTDLVIVRDNLVRYSAVIPYGGKVLTNDIKDACAILSRYAEKLKKEFGSTWPGANLDTDIVSIPVIQGLPPKEISAKTLSRIIHARMDELLDDINSELANYRQVEPGKSLIAGVVITGGGALLKHMPQFVIFKTQMSCRIGYPNIYLSDENRECLTSPMYSTCIGLVLNGLKDMEPSADEEEDETSAGGAVAEYSLQGIGEKDAVELPLEDVIPAIKVNVAAKTADEDAYSYQSDEEIMKMDAVAEDSEEDIEKYIRASEAKQQEKQPDPVKTKPVKKSKQGWDKRIEKTIYDFLKKIE